MRRKEQIYSKVELNEGVTLMTKKDLESLLDKAKRNNLSLITTEKDYVRVPEDYRKNIDCFKIKLEIPNIDKLIRNLIN